MFLAASVPQLPSVFKMGQGRLGGSVGKRPTSAQVTISRFAGSSPASGSGLRARNLEAASDSVSLSLSAPPPFILPLSQK